MKNNLSVIVVVIALMAVFASSVSAAPAETKSVNLVSVEYGSSGIVLKFETSGLTRADLKDATFYAASNNQDINCRFINHTTDVRCTVTTSLAGQGDFHVTLGGVGFWGTLPQSTECADNEDVWYSLNVYDHGELVDSGDVPAAFWNFLKREGLLELAAEQGITFDQTGRFCGPAFDEFPT